MADPRRRRRIDAPELAILAALALFAVIPLVAMLRHAASADLVFAGADGPFPADQFQYMSWVRDFADGSLGANNLDTAPSDGVFFHPMFALSGAASAAGASMGVAYLIWKPVAVLALFLGFLAYVRRFLEDGVERWTALAVALFFATPTVAIATWGSIGSETQLDELGSVAGEALPATLLWGYLPSAISVGLMPAFLLGVERLARDPAGPGRGRIVLLTTACGAVVSWLHPWQGEVLLITVLVAVALERRPVRERTVLVAPLAGLVGPLAYYFLLSRFDAAWDVAQAATAEGGHVALAIMVVGLAPLVAPALLGLRREPLDLGERMLRVWPAAALAVYFVFSPSFPQHALEGISLPLAIMAVRGLAGVRWRAAVLAALAVVLTVPGIAFMLDFMNDTVERGGQPHYLQHGEDDALSHLDSLDEPGAVLATPYLGALVPSRTGRDVWVAHPSWTEDFDARVRDADDLFAGRLPRARALELVRSSGTRFLLRDCGRPRDPLEALRPAVVPEREIGCAGIYRVAIE